MHDCFSIVTIFLDYQTGLSQISKFMFDNLSNTLEN